VSTSAGMPAAGMSSGLWRGARRCCLLDFVCHAFPPFRLLRDRGVEQLNFSG
jgi:hypothetical protein